MDGRTTRLHINSLRKYNFPETETDGVNMMVISGDAETDDDALITSLPNFPDRHSGWWRYRHGVR